MFAKTIAVALMCSIVFTAGVRVQDKDSGKLDDKAKLFLEKNGVAQTTRQSLDQMIEAFRNMPGLREGFLDEFKKQAKIEDLVSLCVPIYRKHLDERTLDAAIAFFATPEGAKLAAAQPAIQKECMEAGKKWGEETARKAMAALDK